MSKLLLQSGIRPFAQVLQKLAIASPDRLTVTQLSFFLQASHADLLGKPMTFSEIREELGGELSRSLHTTYKVFIDESRNRGSKREPGLGWLTREIDPVDNRRKYLRLTPKGRGILLLTFDG